MLGEAGKVSLGKRTGAGAKADSLRKVRRKASEGRDWVSGMVAEKQSPQTNEELELQVTYALQSARVSTQRIVIVARSGRVFLYGYAYSLDERKRIEAFTLTVPGVSFVENHLCVNLFA